MPAAAALPTLIELSGLSNVARLWPDYGKNTKPLLQPFG
jgi:hypothetical protein